jgi:hypothetical protein
MIDYYAFAFITQAVTFLPTIYLILKRYSSWTIFFTPIIISIIMYVIAKYSGVVSTPVSDMKSIANLNMLSGAEYYLYLGMFIMYFIFSIVVGTLLQKYKGFGFLESIGFGMLLGTITASYLNYQIA